MADKWTPNEEQRATLVALRDEVKKEKSQAEFNRQYCGFEESVFSKILATIDPEKPRCYFDDLATEDARAQIFRRLERTLQSLPARRLKRETEEQLTIHAISHFQAVAIAIEKCKNRKTAQRLIQYTGPTGASKSTLSLYLPQRLGDALPVRHVNCRDSWYPATRDLRRRAKQTVLRDICEGLGIQIPEHIWKDSHKDEIAIEDELVNYLSKKPILLFIDEGRFLSAYALNLIIDLLNRTKVVILLAGTLIASARWHRYFPDEAEQVDRRTAATIRIDRVTVADAALFFPTKQFVDQVAALKLISEQASRFGHFALVGAIAKRLAKHATATEDQVLNAVEKSLAEVNHAVHKTK